MKKTIRLLLNGKRATQERVRAAVYAARRRGQVEVRVTWERGDMRRLIREAHAEGCTRIMAGGGDGTVQEAVDALMRLPPGERPELAVLPLGTANDLASACGIPLEPLAALHLALDGRARAVDCVQADETYFMNVASCGLAAELTRGTSEGLKSVLRGGAYTLAALIKARNFTSYQGRLRMPDREIKGEFVLGAVCNGRQAGGGQVLAPTAFIDDGLLDIMVLRAGAGANMGQIIHELLSPDEDGVCIKRYQAPWTELSAETDIPINLDGEPIDSRCIRFQNIPGAIRLVLPPFCPLLVLRNISAPS